MPNLRASVSNLELVSSGRESVTFFLVIVVMEVSFLGSFFYLKTSISFFAHIDNIHTLEI